jgi:broad specificity phosphatase PhoE
MTRILLIRHGETDGNKANKVQGHTNTPLNEKGHLQAETLSRGLKKDHPELKAIYASDLTRAHETALKTAKKFDLPIQLKPTLRERHFGTAEGSDVDEMVAIYGDPDWIYAPIPEAETREEMVKRLKGEIHAIAKNHHGEKIALFSHGLAICTFIVECTGPENLFYLNNCDVALFSFDIHKDELLFKYDGIYKPK